MNVLFFILLLFIEMQKSTGNIYFSAISHLSDLWSWQAFFIVMMGINFIHLELWNEEIN